MSKKHEHKHIPLILWPFKLIWDLLAWIVGLTGRLIAIIIGGVLLLVGAILIALVITLPLGIPLALIGFLLLVKGLF